MDERYEAMIKNANSMETVREKCNNEGEGLKNATQASVKSCIDVVEDRFPCVSLKENKLKIGQVASEEDISSLFDSVSMIDPAAEMESTAKAIMAKFTQDKDGICFS